jgi:hypothetical protein
MTAKKTVGALLCTAAMVAVTGYTNEARGSDGTVIVLPARQRIVQVGFHVNQISRVTLVSYAAGSNPQSPLLHTWNGHSWTHIGIDDYLGGTFLPANPERVILIGSTGVLPARLAVDPVWAGAVQRIPSLDTATIVNELGQTLKFSTGSWRWIAEQNGLQVEDTNAQRRRYGKYGPPGQKTKPAPGSVDGIEMPPAPPMPAAPTTTDLKPTPVPAEPVPAVVAPAVVAPVVESKPAPEARVEPTPAAIPEVKPVATNAVSVVTNVAPLVAPADK